MDLHIPEETERLVRELAGREGIAPEEAVRRAVEDRLARSVASSEKARRWLNDFYGRYPPPADRTSLPKSFYDGLNDD